MKLTRKQSVFGFVSRRRIKRRAKARNITKGHVGTTTQTEQNQVAFVALEPVSGSHESNGSRAALRRASTWRRRSECQSFWKSPPGWASALRRSASNASTLLRVISRGQRASASSD
jgi:hypothetical protein